MPFLARGAIPVLPPHPNWFTDLMERIKGLEYLAFHVEMREPGQLRGICVALFDSYYFAFSFLNRRLALLVLTLSSTFSHYPV